MRRAGLVLTSELLLPRPRPQVCPPGCEQPVYDRVVELRDARLDEEGAAADVARALEGLRKDLDLLARKRRIVDAALAAINQVGTPMAEGRAAQHAGTRRRCSTGRGIHEMVASDAAVGLGQVCLRP